MINAFLGRTDMMAEGGGCAGDLDECLRHLKDKVRLAAENPLYHVFLFQRLIVAVAIGLWCGARKNNAPFSPEIVDDALSHD